ncbi:MAG: response regulator [Spirochaetaceae bacterium]|nr:MAG: response regulator [Spirochaetaceae bacterium]
MSDSLQQRCDITNLPTKPIFRAALAREITHSPNELWVFAASIDRIDVLNQQYGRSAGDDVLAGVARIIGERAGELMFRYDGPVFIGIIRADVMEVLGIAEAIRRSIHEATHFVEPLSVSVGLVSGSEVEDAEELEQQATSRMRIARRRGGNQVCASGPSESESGLATGTVVIVDPAVEMLDALIRELESGGLTVVSVDDGLEAMQLVTQLAPQVIITEVSVPKIGGLALRDRLRTIEGLSGIPFILMSHRKNDDLIREAAALGILHYFRKPVSAVEIGALVQNLARLQAGESLDGCT